jgi:CO/xanthine dehydrogenase FAD-binding subunit
VNVSAPTSLREALDALDAVASAPEPHVLAGGTDFMVEVNFDLRRPEHVVSLHRLDELRTWSHHGRLVRVGAGVTCASLESDFVAIAPALAHAARTVGSPQIRNVATLGGNLGTASPAGDLLPVLSALDATIHCARRGESRAVSIHDFLIGPKRHVLAVGELITGVEFDATVGPQEFVKVGMRNAMVIAVASVAAVRTDGTIRVALGSVGPTVIRARAAEDWLAVRGLDPEAAGEFGARVAAEARPIDDHRATAAYRRHAVAVCATRAARRLMEGG